MVSTVMGSFAGGFSPSVQSLALMMTAPQGSATHHNENGKVFGAMGVVQALGYVVA